jgi:hypothetical protein
MAGRKLHSNSSCSSPTPASLQVKSIITRAGGISGHVALGKIPGQEINLRTESRVACVHFP